MNIQGFLNLIWFSCLFPLLTDYFLQFKILCLPIGLYILFLSIIKLLVSKFLESHLSNSNKHIHKPSSRPHGIFSSHSKNIQNIDLVTILIILVILISSLKISKLNSSFYGGKIFVGEFCVFGWK